MDQKLKEAIRLRTLGQTEAAKQILLELVSAKPNHPIILYQCAWTHDAMGLEREAVGFYERAITNGLEGNDLAGAYLGLGSTLRGL
jgi:tetratricopeptide (TPR) repeat protein